MENNLIIGNNSQISYYFPNSYIKISSRNIDYDILSQKWNSVYITFAEQRIYDNDIDYITTNYKYTLNLIDRLIDKCDKIVVYSSCDLWNNCGGEITLETKFNYKSKNDYLLSKHMLINKIRDDNKYDKVIIIHPFYFNSVHRNKYFLFGRIFDSIINKKKIEIGNTYYYRDMVHTKYMVDKSIESITDNIVGSGRLYFVNDFIRDLYKHFDMNYDYFVKEKIDDDTRPTNIFYSKQTNIYTYQQLLDDTTKDIENNLLT